VVDSHGRFLWYELMTTDTKAAKAAPADPKIRAKLESIRSDHSGLPRPPEAGRPVGHEKH